MVQCSESRSVDAIPFKGAAGAIRDCLFDHLVGELLTRKKRALASAARQSRSLACGRLWEFLTLPNCAVEVFVHARRQGLVVLLGDVFAYHLRGQEAVTANATMPLVVGENVRTPLGAFRVVFWIGHRLNNRSVAVEAQEKAPLKAGSSTVVMAEGKGASATRQFAVGEWFRRLGLLVKAPLPFSPLSFPVAEPGE
jgi:hypothetical protein